MPAGPTSPFAPDASAKRVHAVHVGSARCLVTPLEERDDGGKAANGR
jgi:hypothetical protein